MVASDELHPKVTDVKQIVGASRANQSGRFSSHAGRATSAASPAAERGAVIARFSA
jgi:hypothetical protein